MFLLVGTALITLILVWLAIWQERTFNKKGDQ